MKISIHLVDNSLTGLRLKLGPPVGGIDVVVDRRRIRLRRPPVVVVATVVVVVVGIHSIKQTMVTNLYTTDTNFDGAMRMEMKKIFPEPSNFNVKAHRSPPVSSFDEHQRYVPKVLIKYILYTPQVFITFTSSGY